jgi:two-component system, chemotaxis family, protein-glutamate methylesterase/glutaminase
MKKIKLLIVDDSPVACELLKYVAETDPLIEVIGFASNGLETLEYLKKSLPDVILMDIHMPYMDGFETTRQIMLNRPVPIIICSADYTPKDVQKGFQAIEAGALVILEKPQGPLHPKFRETAKLFVDTIKMVSEIKLITRKLSKAIQKPLAPVQNIQLKNISAVAIGASLGGPQALQTIFSELSSKFPIPIFVVQHIAEDFAKGLADWLNRTSALEMLVAENGMKALPSKIYIAPGRSYMEILEGEIIKIVKTSEENEPAISRLFHSMAKIYGNKGLGIILTGMGRDGVDGLLAMKKKGAITIAQSEEDCVMFGMPKEAASIGAATHITQLKDISSVLNQLI